jgi:hypothetical protein
LGEAQDAFSKALEFNHGDGLALSNLAFAYSQQGKGRESIPLFYKSIALLNESRDKAVAWNRLGNVYRELNEYEDAVAAYQMADMVEHGKTPLLSPDLENTRVFQNENGSAAVQDCELPVETIESITADSPYWIFNPALNTGINKSPASDVQAYARPDAEEDHVPGLNEAVEKEKGVVMQESLAANPLPASLRPALQVAQTPMYGMRRATFISNRKISMRPFAPTTRRFRSTPPSAGHTVTWRLCISPRVNIRRRSYFIKEASNC